jgi:hypothetical protein
MTTVSELREADMVEDTLAQPGDGVMTGNVRAVFRKAGSQPVVRKELPDLLGKVPRIPCPKVKPALKVIQSDGRCNTA